MPENTSEKLVKKKRGPKKRDLMRITSSITEGDLINRSRVWCQFLEERLPLFTALNPAFNATFCNNWRAAIAEFEALPTAEVKDDEQVTARVWVEQKRKIFFDLVDMLEFYVRLAYPKEPFRAAAFGLTRIRSQANKRGVRDVVIGFAMALAINKHLAELTAAGMPPTFVTDFDFALGEYADAEVKHQYSLLDSVSATHDRVLAFNNLYSIHRHVSSAADVIFANDKVKADLFR